MTKQVLTPEVIEALRQIDSPTISNAIEEFQVRDPVTGYASLELRCQFPEASPMVGYAVTCTAGENRPSRLQELLDVFQAAPKPAVLVIKYVGNDRLRSCYLGDIFCTSLQKLGGVGIVTDGGARDRTGIKQRAPGFQLFSPGWVVSHGLGSYLDFGITVSICGLTIQPGDLLHGDESGLLTIPQELAQSVAEKAREVHRVEAEFFDFLQSDAFSFDALKQRIGFGRAQSSANSPPKNG
jgi:regulator of RNase E activity RraA